jgi:hypothetical protein
VKKPQKRLTIKVSVVKVNEAQRVSGEKVKQEVVVADSKGKATVTLWETDKGLLNPQKSYQLNRLKIQSYQGKHHLVISISCVLSMTWKTSYKLLPSSDGDNDEEQLQGITIISGIRQPETINKNMTQLKKLQS